MTRRAACLPCRRSRVRVPSAAPLKALQSRAFLVSNPELRPAAAARRTRSADQSASRCDRPGDRGEVALTQAPYVPFVLVVREQCRVRLDEAVDDRDLRPIEPASCQLLRRAVVE